MGVSLSAINDPNAPLVRSPQMASVLAPAPSGVVNTAGSGPDTLTLWISQDHYQGDAQYVVYVDGVQIGGTFTAKGLRKSGQYDILEIKGDWGVGNHTVGIRFVNDLYHGTADTDRNLYLDGAVYNGLPVSGVSRAIMSGTVSNFTVADTGLVSPGRFVGTDASEYITAGTGNDTIDGGGGNDSLVGGDGDDLFIYSGASNGFDFVNGGTGFNAIRAMSANTVIGLRSMSGIQEISANGYWNVRIAGSDGGPTGEFLDFSTVRLYGIAAIDAGMGHDTIIGSAAGDVITGGTGNDLLDGFGGTDRISGDSGNDTLIGGNGSDTLDGGTGDDSLIGGIGDDDLIGGAGNDTLDGGDGADYYTFSGTSGGFDVLIGGAGYDYVRAAADGTVIGLRSFSGIEVIAGNGHTGVTVAGSDTTNDRFDFTGVTLVAINAINGGGGNDTITGSAGKDTINGGAGADVLEGAGGDDVISGGAGKDWLTGGRGADLFSYTHASETSHEAENRDVITDWEAVDRLDFRKLDADPSRSGIQALVFVGLGPVSNTIATGQLKYFHDNGDTFVLGDVAGDGVGAFKIQINGIHNLTIANFLGVSEASRADAGTTFDDVLRGTAGADVIRGIDGNDTMLGSAGADTLDGGIGTDTADYSLSAQGVDVDLNRASQIGGDAAGDVLTAIENVVGSAFADVLRGGLGANLLAGGGGNDVLAGRGLADTLDGGAGIDTADYSESIGGVTVDLTLPMQSGGDAARDVLISIENVTGSKYSDWLYGDAGANALSGGAGDDTLVGRGGADRLDGGDGRDTADYSAAASAVRVDLTLGTGAWGEAQGDVLVGIENLKGTAFADHLRGDAGSNVIDAGAGDDTIVGSAGPDTVYGGAGNDHVSDYAGTDWLDGGAGFDVIDFSSFTGGGTINLNAAYALVQGERNSLYGFEHVIGTRGDDIITGSHFADVIDGHRGDDVLSGGLGNDTFRFGTGFGTDIVMDFQRGYDRLDFTQLGIGFSDLRFMKAGTDLLVQVSGIEDTVLVRGVAATGLGASDFLFA